MTKAEKANVIEALQEKFSGVQYFYIADSSTLPVEEVNALRRVCFEKGVGMQVAKNTLIQKALERIGNDSYTPLFDTLKGPSTIFFSEEISNLPAKIIKDFRKTHEKPLLKAAFIDNEVYIGDEQLEMLASLKSKHELIADVIGLLQSPAKNVISALQSGGDTLARLLQALEERGQEQ